VAIRFHKESKKSRENISALFRMLSEALQATTGGWRGGSGQAEIWQVLEEHPG
jgi:hypothetical protein